MGTSESEKTGYEDEGNLPLQQKEKPVQEANKRREMDYNRGRRAVKGMLILFSATQVLSLIIKPTQNLLAWFLSLTLAATLVYNIWHGKRWARNFFAVLVGWTILLALHGISELNITRTDYDSQRNYNGGATLIFYGGICQCTVYLYATTTAVNWKKYAA